MARGEEFISTCDWPNSSVFNIAGISLGATIHVLRKARSVVSIDTSITHLTAALGGRVLSLHGPSKSKRWGPTGPAASAIDSAVPGSGYMNWGADSSRKLAGLKCMEGITTDQVIGRISKMLA